MDPIPLHVETLYAELVQRCIDAPGRGGSVYERTLKGIRYVYAKTPVGEKREDRFLGRAGESETLAAVDAVRAANAAGAGRRSLVRLIKSAGVPSPTHMLGAVLETLVDAELARDLVVVGTAAYQCYSPVIGYRLPAAALSTQDADFATATLAIAGRKAGESFEQILQRADSTFAAVPGLDPRKPPSRFRAGNGFLVDLLTPLYRRSDRNPMSIPALSAGAVPMQQLDWFIADPMQAVALHGSGVLVRVPQPARFAIHKLIVAQKRGIATAKRQKDLLQAGSLIEALKSRDPWSLRDAYADAAGKGKRGWALPIERSLREIGISI